MSHVTLNVDPLYVGFDGSVNLPFSGVKMDLIDPLTPTNLT